MNTAANNRDVTIGEMILRRISENPSGPALRIKDGERWRDISWSTLSDRMANLAAGIMTAIDGLEARSAIAIIGNTNYDWIACDFAALSIGLRTVPVYATLLPEEAGYIHVDTESVITIVEDAKQLEKVREFRTGFSFFERDYSGDEVTIQHIVVMNPEGIEPADDWESLADLEARGRARLEVTADKRKEWAAQPKREDTCTYTYTSGTTGPPKGAIQSNENMLSMLENIAETGLFRDEVREGGLFLFLPLAHSFGRLIELSGPFFNAPIVISSVPSLGADLLGTQPGFFPGAPRVFEKMKARIESKVAGAPPIRQKLFKAAIAAGKRTIPYRSKGAPLPLGVKIAYRLADKVVLSKLRAALGFDRASVLLSGSAPLNVEVHAFFLACGLDLLEAYGLTETCPGLTGNRPGQFRLGTVGPALPGVTIKIASDGEILAKGPNIVKGYLNRPEATAEAFNDEGWFCTGDLGSIDRDGFIKITGRKKEMMKTSGGKFIAPAKIEGRLKNHTLIQEAVVVADLRNYATTLLAIDVEELGVWAEQAGVPAEPDHPAVAAEVQRHVDEVNKTLASFESIKYFRLVPAMTVDDGILTASLKVKRKVVYERYADVIEDMYASGRK